MARSRTNQNDEGTAMATMPAGITELNDEALAEILAASRTRGVYDEQMEAFLGADIRGVQVSLEDGAFAGKKANSIKTGFEGAKRRIDANKNNDFSDETREKAAATKVVLHSDKVFLIRTDLSAPDAS